MSHNTAGIAPHVLSFTPSAFAAAGVQTLTVNGTKLSTTCRLSMPAAMGTVVSGPVLSNVTSTQADATWTVNILTPTDVTYTCTVSNGGLGASGVSIDIFHGFSPEDLLDDDGQWYDSTDLVNANPHTGVRAWNPTIYYPGGGVGFTFSSSDGGVSTTTGGTESVRMFTGYKSSTAASPQFSHSVNAPNSATGSWTVALVFEVTQTAWDAGHTGRWWPIFSGYWGAVTLHCYGAGDFRVGTRVRLGKSYTETATVGLHSFIATYHATTGTNGTVYGYLDGVEVVNRTESGTSYQTETDTLSHGNYANADFDTWKLGDMFFKAGSIDTSEVANLHTFWSNKYGF